MMPSDLDKSLGNCQRLNDRLHLLRAIGAFLGPFECAAVKAESDLGTAINRSGTAKLAESA